MSLSKKYEIVLEGQTPLLMHKDNISFTDSITTWLKDPVNKKRSVAGDDRSPAWKWIGYTYDDGKNLSLDSDCFMTMLRDAGKSVSSPINKKATMKRTTQSGMTVLELNPEFFLLRDGKEQHIPFEPIQDLIGEESFNKHAELAKSLGFELFVKRAAVGTSKHIRVRPMFTDWGARLSFNVIDERRSGLTEEVLKEIWTYAGEMCGLCDWRPSSKTPGRFGMFKVKSLKRI